MTKKNKNLLLNRKNAFAGFISGFTKKKNTKNNKNILALALLLYRGATNDRKNISFFNLLKNSDILRAFSGFDTRKSLIPVF